MEGKKSAEQWAADAMKKLGKAGISLYGAQEEFIRAGIRIVEGSEGAVGIFSSPTGTGKTLSLLMVSMGFLSQLDSPKKRPEVGALSHENLSLLKGCGFFASAPADRPVVLYASKTHEQLSQVAHELRKLNAILGTKARGTVLGSRKVLCINKEVVGKSPSSAQLRNRCKLAIKEGCPFYANRAKAVDKIEGARAGVFSVEDMVAFGRRECVCPYYAAKDWGHESDLLIVPYHFILDPEFFKEQGIDLSKSLVIIDEAHNLYDTIIDAHTVEIKLAHLSECRAKLEEYYSKKHEIAGIREAARAVEKLAKGLARITQKRGCDEDACVGLNEFLIECDLVDANLSLVSEFILEHRLPYKISPLRTGDVENRVESTMMAVSRTLGLLALSDKDSFVFANRDTMKFTTMRPEAHIEHLREAKAVLLSGGTLEPLDEFYSLFKNRRVAVHKYPSVCRRVRVCIVEQGIRGPLNFVYEHRSRMADELILALKNYRVLVKRGGILVFVQSKAMMAEVKKKMRQSCSCEADVLFEDEVDLDFYKQEVLSGKRVCMFCVVNGSFSEGVNFGGDLCRLLIVGGLPFPARSTELELRRAYREPGYLVNSVMKAVNQTMGRAIRGADDYSYIVLMDRRYAEHRQKISYWLQEFVTVKTFRESIIDIKEHLRIFIDSPSENSCNQLDK